MELSEHYPEQQGLKLRLDKLIDADETAFRTLSRTTRIET